MAKKKATKKVEPKAAISRQVIHPSEITEEEPQFLEAHSPPDLVAVPSSTITPLELPVEEIGTEELEASEEITSEEVTTDESDQPVETEKIIVGNYTYNSLDELTTSHQELNKKFTQSSQDHSDRVRFLEDMLKQQTTKAPEKEAPIVLPDNFKEQLYENPEKAAQDLANMVEQQVMAKVSTTLSTNTAKNDELAAQTYLTSKYPEYMTQENMPLLNGWAGASTEPTLVGKYEDAIKQYQSFVGRIKETTVPAVKEEIAQNEAIIKSAKIEGTSSRKPNVKGFTQAQLGKMMRERPEEYQRRQPEIMKAYQEGRVR